MGEEQRDESATDEGSFSSEEKLQAGIFTSIAAFFRSLARAAGLSSRSGKWFVERTIPGLDEKERRKEGKIEVRPFVSAPASVSVSYGMTVNMGNFESARVDIFASLPCYPEEMGKAQEWVSKFVGEKVEAERDFLKKLLKDD